MRLASVGLVAGPICKPAVPVSVQDPLLQLAHAASHTLLQAAGIQQRMQWPAAPLSCWLVPTPQHLALSCRPSPHHPLRHLSGVRGHPGGKPADRAGHGLVRGCDGPGAREPQKDDAAAGAGVRAEPQQPHAVPHPVCPGPLLRPLLLEQALPAAQVDLLSCLLQLKPCCRFSPLHAARPWLWWAAHTPSCPAALA